MVCPRLEKEVLVEKLDTIRDKFVLRWYCRLLSRSLSRYLSAIYREDWLNVMYDSKAT